MNKHDMQGNDYVSVAKFRMEGVHDWQSEEGSTDATNLVAIIDAQVAATLALAYEQRTANLIAAFAQDELDSSGVHCIDYSKLSDQIKERLGLA